MQITPLDKWIKKKIGYRGVRDFRRELDDYTLNKIQENIDYVKKNSLFYKAHFKNVDKINSFKEFEKLPFTSSLNLSHSSNHFVCVSQSHINRIVTLKTSGTSGESKRVFFTEEDQELTIDFFKNGMSSLVEEGYKVLILLPGHREGSVANLLQRALNRIGVESYIYEPIYDVEKILEIIKKNSIDTIVGTPIQLFSIVNYKENELDINVKTVLLSTDYAPDIVIEKIEEAFKCKVFDHYGMTEMGLGGGVQCKAFNGYHLREADLYFEIINPITEKKLSAGKYGEVVFTTLTRTGMPLIRYRTGDISRIIDKPCPCGTEIKRLDKVISRIEGCVVLADGEILTMGELAEIVFSIDGIVDFDAIITERCDKDCLTIYAYAPYIKDNLFITIFNKLQSYAPIMRLIKENKLILNIKRKNKDLTYCNGIQKKKIIDMRNKG